MSYSPTTFSPQTSITSAVVTQYVNGSTTTAIPQGQACSINSSGYLVPLDVSSQASFQAFVGYAQARIPASASLPSAPSIGPIIANGRLQNFTTGFPIGTALYVDTNGNPTSTVPSIGVNGFVSGDAVIFLGVLVPNELNPSFVDIALYTQVVGTL